MLPQQAPSWQPSPQPLQLSHDPFSVAETFTEVPSTLPDLGCCFGNEGRTAQVKMINHEDGWFNWKVRRSRGNLVFWTPRRHGTLDFGINVQPLKLQLLDVKARDCLIKFEYWCLKSKCLGCIRKADIPEPCYPPHVPSVEVWAPDGYSLERLTLPFPMPSGCPLGSFQCSPKNDSCKYSIMRKTGLQ